LHPTLFTLLTELQIVLLELSEETFAITAYSHPIYSWLHTQFTLNILYSGVKFYISILTFSAQYVIQTYVNCSLQTKRKMGINFSPLLNSDKFS